MVAHQARLEQLEQVEQLEQTVHRHRLTEELFMVVAVEVPLGRVKGLL
jgi:hypothetical protein